MGGCGGDDDAASFAPHGTGTKPRDAAVDTGDGSAPVQLPGSTGSGDDPSGSPSSPRDGELGGFAPGEVYLFGTLTETRTCDPLIIANLESPDDGFVGFPCDGQPGGAQINPETGALLYHNGIDRRAREFHCENGCSYWKDGDTYPEQPETNDPVLAEDVCAEAVVQEFRVSPEGDLAFNCGGEWRDATGQKIEHDIWALGRDHLGFDGVHVFDIREAKNTPILDLPRGDFIAYRASDKGFRFVLRVDSTAETQLWEVAKDGAAGMLGAYPPPPEGLTMLADGGVLDSHWALYQLAAISNVDKVVRRTTDGDSQFVYSESGERIVKVDPARLITGP
jgi:hypothetical protein